MGKLVLTRRTDEEVVIRAGDKEITLIVVTVWGNRVRLAFEAPREVEILRSELVSGDPAPAERDERSML